MANFRNYRSLELDLQPGLTVIAGENAQGKTNILEAIYLLATTRSPRTSSDADFVNWAVAREEAPVTRIAGRGDGKRGPVEVELAIAGRASSRARPTAQPWPDEIEDERPTALSVSKRIRVNGVARRASDMVGTIPAVFFSTIDMDLICGTPSLRRRYLDLMLSQVDHHYLSALTRYAKVLTQRNALLKQIQEGAAAPDELDFWDARIAAEGAVIVGGRARAVQMLADKAADAHSMLSAERERLTVRYLPKLAEPKDLDGAPQSAIAEMLTDDMRRQRQRECGAGMTLVGPHRDDLAVLVGAAEASTFGSRAQQRSAALALRLGEAALLHERGGEEPVMLLDDVLSELDKGRREAVLKAMTGFNQVLVTTAEPERFPSCLLEDGRLVNVRAGAIDPKTNELTP